MAENLILRFIAGSDQIRWAVIDGSGALLSAGDGSLDDAAALTEGKRVIAVAPAASVLRLSAAIPLKGAAKIRQALPFALEEQLAADINSQHFAFTKAGEDGRIPVAVIANDLLGDWVERLKAAEIQVDGIFAESDGIPDLPATVGILIDGAETIIRDSSGEFTVTDTESMPMMLEMLLEQHSADMENDATVVPINLLVYCDAETHARHDDLWDRLRMRVETVESRLIGDGALAFLGNQLCVNGGINLLQGDFAPKTELNIEWGPWKIPAALAGSLVLLVLLFQGASYWQLNRTEARLDEAANQLLMATFPDTGEVSDPWGALQNRLGAVADSGGAVTGGPGFAAAMSALTTAFSETPNIKMETLGYRNGTMDLQLIAPNVDALDQLRQRVTEGGRFDANIQSANPDKDVIKGRMQITAVQP